MLFAIGSIHNHCSHLAEVEHFWFNTAAGNLPDALEEMGKKYSRSKYPDHASVKAAWDAQKTTIMTYLDTVYDVVLNDDLTYTFPWCGKQTHPRWECLMYIIEHGIDHRAQMLAGLHELDAPTTAQDFITFVWVRDKTNVSE